MGARVYLDVSRLLLAGRQKTPSGIERVEFAYAKQFGNANGTRFVAFFLNQPSFVPHHFMTTYIKVLENNWSNPGGPGRARAITAMVTIYALLLAFSLRAFLRRRAIPIDEHAVYLNLSHENLDNSGAISRFKSRTGAKLLFFVHDLIPISHPEYVRPGQPEKHRRRMHTVAALADVILVNSTAVRDDFLRHIKAGQPHPPVHVAHLGTGPSAPATNGESQPKTPYFLMLATIEPRKNHLLLLNLWRQLATVSANPPRLIVIGRRGWENEMVLDMLERCNAISGCVEERQGVGDAELAILLQGARALLLPSFAEGYGLPVAEALAAGTPVICSDLPALREIGGEVPEYLNPLDGSGWAQAILDYAEPSSPRRAAQCNRLLSWSAPLWDHHFAQVSAILSDLVDVAHPAGQIGNPLAANAF